VCNKVILITKKQEKFTYTEKELGALFIIYKYLLIVTTGIEFAFIVDLF